MLTDLFLYIVANNKDTKKKNQSPEVNADNVLKGMTVNTLGSVAN